MCVGFVAGELEAHEDKCSTASDCHDDLACIDGDCHKCPEGTSLSNETCKSKDISIFLLQDRYCSHNMVLSI